MKKKLNTKFFYALTCLVLAVGCANDLRQAEDNELRLVVKKANSETASYQARITLRSPALNDAVKLSAVPLAYRMDSCFYLIRAGRRSYPAFVHRVANGQAAALDYLIGFDEDIQQLDTLVYEDRYLNQHVYKIKISD